MWLLNVTICASLNQIDSVFKIYGKKEKKAVKWGADMPDAISSPPLLENSMALTHPKCSFKSLKKRFFEFATRSHNIFLLLTFSDIHLSFKTLKIPLDWYLSDITVKQWMQVLLTCQADIFDGTWVTSLSVSDPEIIIFDRVLYIFLFL